MQNLTLNRRLILGAVLTIFVVAGIVLLAVYSGGGHGGGGGY
jgi:hypothetical protein